MKTPDRGDERVRAGPPPAGQGGAAAAPQPPPASMPDRLGRLGRLVRKELLEILRDRRTIITLVLMPILLYPLLSLAFQQLAVANKMTPQEKMDLRVGFASNSQLEAQVFHDRMEQGTRHLPTP